MAKSKYFEIIRGDTIPIARTVKSGGVIIPGGIAGWIVFVTLKDDLSIADNAALFTHAYTVPAGADADASIFRFEIPQSKTLNLTPTTETQLANPTTLPWLDVQVVQPRNAPDEPFVRTARCQAVIYADATRRVVAP
jgi:hypothetical protein